MEEDIQEIMQDEDDSLTAERNAWDRQAVFLLIKEYKKYRREFSNPDVRKRQYWEKVCNNLSAVGYMFDVEQCEKKWRNLKKTFKDNEGKQVVTWIYYNDLQDIFACEAEVKRQKTADCDEDWKNVNKVLEVKMDGEDGSSGETDMEDSISSSPPPWFLSFLHQYKEDEKKKLQMLEEMHKEIVSLEKQKCSLLKTLIEKLS